MILLQSHQSLSKIIVNDSIIDKPPDKPTPPVPPRRHHGSAATSTPLPHQLQPPPLSSYDLIKLEARYKNNNDRRGVGEDDDATGDERTDCYTRDLKMVPHLRQHSILKHQNQPPIPTPRYKKEVVVSLDPLIYLIIFIIFFILNIY